MGHEVLGKSEGGDDAPGRRTVESGKLLLQRCLAAHRRLGAGVHFDDALMEARDLRFARGKDLIFHSNLARGRSAQALPNFGRRGPRRRTIVRFFRLLVHLVTQTGLALRMSR